MKTNRLYEVLIGCNIKPRYSNLKLHYCPWDNCRFNINDSCQHNDNYQNQCCNIVLLNGKAYCQDYKQRGDG